jgi:hypothetical protein
MKFALYFRELYLSLPNPSQTTLREGWIILICLKRVLSTCPYVIWSREEQLSVMSLLVPAWSSVGHRWVLWAGQKTAVMCGSGSWACCPSGNCGGGKISPCSFGYLSNSHLLNRFSDININSTENQRGT